MDLQSLFPSIAAGLAGFLSGFGLAIIKGFSKIVEDIWSDYREERKTKKERKNQIVTQLLLDIPRGKSQNFYYTISKNSERAQAIAQIAIYDKKMAKRVEKYLNLWSHYAASTREFEKNNQITFIGDDGDVTTEGPMYLEKLCDQLHDEYEEIIDLLNRWKR